MRFGFHQGSLLTTKTFAVAFKQLVTEKHGDQRVTDDLQIKLQLLTVANLLFFRNRNSNWAQGNGWQGTDAQWNHDLTSNANLLGDIWPSEAWGLPQPNDAELDKNFFQMLSQLNIPPRHASSRQNATSLLSILPDFMALCALVTPLIEQERSMEIAAQFMMFASLEQYFIFGQTSSDTFAQAFAWGSPDDTSAKDASIVDSTRLWRRKRAEYIKPLLPRVEISIESQYRSLWISPSLHYFEENVLDYLILLLTRVNIPVLTQLEDRGSRSFNDPD
jgi:hypothetical protein